MGRGFAARLSDDILQEMWEKWILIATLAGITSLMRASVGDVVGDLLRRSDPSRPTPVLRIVQAHLATYEARRARESATT